MVYQGQAKMSTLTKDTAKHLEELQGKFIRGLEFAQHIIEQVNKFGNLPVVGGYVMDDTKVQKLIPLNKDGEEVYTREEAISFFIE